MKTMKNFTLFGLLAIFMFVLAACGGASDEELAAAGRAGAEAALAAQATAEAENAEVEEPAEELTCEGALNGHSYNVDEGRHMMGDYKLTCSELGQVLSLEKGQIGECNGYSEGGEDESDMVYSLAPGHEWQVGGTTIVCPASKAEIEETAPEPSAVPEAVVEIVTPVKTTSTLTPTYSLDIDGFDGPIVLSGWAPKELSANGDWYEEYTANDTWDSVTQTWKRGSEGCEMPAACNVYGPEGALLADDYNEARANDSAIWGGSIWHGSPDNTQSSFSLLCPEGSYCDAYALNFGLVEIGPAGNPYITLEIPTCGEHCGQGLLIRNWLSRPGVDLNTTVIISKYGEPGAASWSEYTVDPDDAERFSQSYGTDQAENAHVRNNNGSGPGDNNRFYQWVFDMNDMSLSLMLHTANNGWVKVWTNVVSYGTH